MEVQSIKKIARERLFLIFFLKNQAECPVLGVNSWFVGSVLPLPIHLHPHPVHVFLERRILHALVMRHIEQVRRGEFIQFGQQLRCVIGIAAEGQVDVGAGPVIALGAGTIDFCPGDVRVPSQATLDGCEDFGAESEHQASLA